MIAVMITAMIAVMIAVMMVVILGAHDAMNNANLYGQRGCRMCWSETECNEQPDKQWWWTVSRDTDCKGWVVNC
jgi:hypothetical protein